MLKRSSIPTALLDPDHAAALSAAMTSIQRAIKGRTSGSVAIRTDPASRRSGAIRSPAGRSVTTCLCAARTVMGRVVAEVGGCAKPDRVAGCLVFGMGARFHRKSREADLGRASREFEPGDGSDL